MAAAWWLFFNDPSNRAEGLIGDFVGEVISHAFWTPDLSLSILLFISVLAQPIVFSTV